MVILNEAKVQSTLSKKYIRSSSELLYNNSLFAGQL